MLRNFKKPLALSIALIMTSAVYAYAEETPVETVEAEAVETVETVETETDNVETAETEAIVETDDAAETDEVVDNIVSEPDDTETADKPATRLDVAEAIFALAGETETESAAPFSDTGSPAVAWLYENGIGAGFEDGTFRPDENVTREQLAMFIYNYMKYQGKDVPTSREWVSTNIRTTTTYPNGLSQPLDTAATPDLYPQVPVWPTAPAKPLQRPNLPVF